MNYKKNTFLIILIILDFSAGCLTRFGETENYPQEMIKKIKKNYKMTKFLKYLHLIR